MVKFEGIQTMENENMQWEYMKEKWYRRLTECGVAEIDEDVCTKGEKSVEQKALRYQKAMVDTPADGSGTDV